jgi:hypothetical protein
MASLFAVLLLPAHYHLHHFNGIDSTAHAHVVDLHIITDNQALTHHDEGTSIFKATPDGIVKKENPAFMPYLLLVFSLLILSISLYRDSSWSDQDNSETSRYYPFFSPPLRAPPAR